MVDPTDKEIDLVVSEILGMPLDKVETPENELTQTELDKIVNEII